MGEKIEFTAWVVSIDSGQSLVGPKLCLRLTGETPKNLMDVLESTGAYHVILEPLEPKLKPCPFCGGKAELLDGREISGLDPGFWVTCSQCGAEGPEYDSNGRQHAINAWNRRDAS